MMVFERTINSVLYSADKSLLQTEVIHQFLSKESYWAKDIPLEIVQAAINGSFCFAAYSNGQQVAFARVISDGAVFGYMADVFVLAPFRGKGIGKELINFIIDYPLFKNLRRFMLSTKDAHGLYRQFGFGPVQSPEQLMETKGLENYS